MLHPAWMKPNFKRNVKLETSFASKRVLFHREIRKLLVEQHPGPSQLLVTKMLFHTEYRRGEPPLVTRRLTEYSTDDSRFNIDNTRCSRHVEVVSDL